MLSITDGYGFSVDSHTDPIERYRVALALVRKAQSLLRDNHTEPANRLRRGIDAAICEVNKRRPA